MEYVVSRKEKAGKPRKGNRRARWEIELEKGDVFALVTRALRELRGKQIRVKQELRGGPCGPGRISNTYRVDYPRLKTILIQVDEQKDAQAFLNFLMSISRLQIVFVPEVSTSSAQDEALKMLKKLFTDGMIRECCETSLAKQTAGAGLVAMSS